LDKLIRAETWIAMWKQSIINTNGVRIYVIGK